MFYPFCHVYFDTTFPSSVNVVCIYFCRFACIHDRRWNVWWKSFLCSWVQHLIFKHLAPSPLLSMLFRCVRCCFLSVLWNESQLKKKKTQHTSNVAERVLNNMSNSFITARITVRSSLWNITVWNWSLYKEDKLHSMLSLRRWIWKTTHVSISARWKRAQTQGTDSWVPREWRARETDGVAGFAVSRRKLIYKQHGPSVQCRTLQSLFHASLVSWTA